MRTIPFFFLIDRFTRSTLFETPLRKELSENFGFPSSCGDLRNSLDARDKYANDRGTQLDTHTERLSTKGERLGSVRFGSVRYGSADKIVDRWSVSLSKWNALVFETLSKPLFAALRIRGKGGIKSAVEIFVSPPSEQSRLQLKSDISVAGAVYPRFHEKRSNRDATGWP